MGLDDGQNVGRETELQWPSDLWLISQGGWCHEPSWRTQCRQTGDGRSALKLCWRCEPDLQGSKLSVQRVLQIWSSGEKAGLGVKTWVSTAHRRKEEPGPGTVPGRVLRRCLGREPQFIRDRRRVTLPREARQHLQEGMVCRTERQREAKQHKPHK